MLGTHRTLPLVQYLGAVSTPQGRCVAFPNVYQHQVQPFTLADATKPGHRKIVALFLVDPHLSEPRPSTSIVLPQQKAWMGTALHKIARAPNAGLLGRLPSELIDLVVDNMWWLFDREYAEARRRELMDERTVMVKSNTEAMFAAEFAMCEH
jgi:hypothetical protein